MGNVIDHIGPPLTSYCNLDQGIYQSIAGGSIANNIVYDVAAFGIQTWHAAAGVTIGALPSYDAPPEGPAAGRVYRPLAVRDRCPMGP